MLKHFLHGKFKNKLKTVYSWSAQPVNKPFVKFAKVLIIRGIGYRAYSMINDFMYSKSHINSKFVASTRPIFTAAQPDDIEILNQSTSFEFPFKRYLIIRAGHTDDLYIPLKPNLHCQTSKKDRKLVILSYNKTSAANLAKRVHKYRPPSVYTGRGVRVKHIKPIRKAGKKDKQKGRAF